MKILEFMNTMVQEGKIYAGDSSLAFLKENCFKVDEKTGTHYYALGFNEIQNYNFQNLQERHHKHLTMLLFPLQVRGHIPTKA